MRTRTFLIVLVVCTSAMGGALKADSPGGMVTASDLQHHRWILESINGEAISTGDDDGMIPELDFGEQMTVSGNTGCNRMSGKAELRDGAFLILNMASTRRMCAPPRDELERAVQKVLGQESIISIDENNNLILATDDVVLRFRLRDWVS
jgi:heat shock protein HslJ